MKTNSKLPFLFVLACVGCGDDLTPVVDEFLDGTVDDPQIGMVVTSRDNAFRMFQLGDPSSTRAVPLGASSAVTPVGFVRSGDLVAVPLGNAASVAVIDARRERVDRFFLFPSGNATGAAFVDDQTIVAANLTTDEVGRIRLSQAGNDIEDLVSVAPAPTDVVAAGGTAYIVSSNLDDTFSPLGPGVVTAIDPSTMTITGQVETGGNNATAAALGPDGRLYVLNTEDYAAPGSLAVIDLGTMQRIDIIAGMGVGPGDIHIDAQGLAYISGFFFGTLVWDTNTQTFVRGPGDPVCAPLSDGSCRGAFAAATDRDGRLYQAFFGSSSKNLAPWVFVYATGTLALIDSIAAGQGPTAIGIADFAETRVQARVAR